MADQATILRSLMEQKQAKAEGPRHTPDPMAATIAVTSGKGGVGKSNIALNLAIALAEQDASVCLLDANLGLGNIDLLCGLNGYWNLSHVITGARSLRDVILKGPRGVSVIPGASGLSEVADCSEAAQQELLNQMEELERTHDFLVLDTCSGIHRAVRQFVSASDVALIITTPEPTSVADAYATIKTLSTLEGPRLEILVNRADSPQQTRAIVSRIQQTARVFLRTDIVSAGSIPADPAVAGAVAKRIPFVLETPHAPATKAVEQLARRLKASADAHPTPGRFFGRLWHRLTRKAA